MEYSRRRAAKQNALDVIISLPLSLLIVTMVYGIATALIAIFVVALSVTLPLLVLLSGIKKIISSLCLSTRRCLKKRSCGSQTEG